MAVTTNFDETNMALFYKGLFEWWNEETEYLFQRIQRWAALTKGYNRLRSERLSKGRLTMHAESGSKWNFSSNKRIFLRTKEYFIEDSSWSPSFYVLKRNQRRSRQEEKIKINRNADSVLRYRTNDNLDSTCLENYRYDNSIYFKTIGEIRNDKKNLRAINDDLKKKNFLIDVELEKKEEEKEEEKKGEEKEEEEGREEKEGEEEEGEEKEEEEEEEEKQEEEEEEEEKQEEQGEEEEKQEEQGEEEEKQEEQGEEEKEEEEKEKEVEEEEEKEKEEEEEVEGEGKDYEPILVYNSIDDKFYLGNDDSRDKFNSNQNDVGVWPIIDLANLDLNLKISNMIYRKNEVKWMIETNNSNMEIIENNIENRNDYESGRFNHGLKNEFRKNQNETKGDLTFKMIKPAGMIKRFTVCQDNNVSSGRLLNYTRNVNSTFTSPCHRYSINLK
ncbi:hypothetical protein V1478_018919 [Vespula squamosa]|uniref:Uncharacterized protein n=1 Tax=Vespula squamosa TaxID=30214 RepID=A0ABD1ZU43_VESSQ